MTTGFGDFLLTIIAGYIVATILATIVGVGVTMLLSMLIDVGVIPLIVGFALGMVTFIIIGIATHQAAKSVEK